MKEANMRSFVIEGFSGTGSGALEGSIAVSGAKNAALKALAAALLFSDAVTIENIPDIEDVNRMEELLTELGVQVTRERVEKRAVVFAPENTEGVLNEAAERMRSSVVLTGPLLARYGRVIFPHPGGCVIGPRPIDQFLHAYEAMGARISTNDTGYVLEAPHGLSGADFFFTIVSVTATESVMMAATRAKGTTHLLNAAMEPEIVALADFLNTCGAKIKGAGTPSITIEGTPDALRAHGNVYRIMPDRIEAGSFLILGALAARELSIENCVPEHNAILIKLLRNAGAHIEVKGNTIVVRGKSAYRAVDIRTHEYPGFATDLQAPMTVFLTQASGSSRVFETIFDGRLSYTDDLKQMGADITLWNHREIEVRGQCPLLGRELAAPDLRAGLAFIIAALVAEGRSTIGNAYYIDRGYEHIDQRLRSLGASISRT